MLFGFNTYRTCFFLFILTTPVQAQHRSHDPLRFLQWFAADVRASGGAILNTAPAAVAAATLSLGAISAFDASWSESSLGWRNRELMRVLEEMGDASAARPLSVILFVGSLFGSNSRFQDAAFTSLESLVLANILTNALKFVLGRERPWQHDDPSVFKPFSGNTSFPSGHATTAFAAAVPWLLYYPNVVTVSITALAVGTAISRMPLQFHWPTDILAGAMLGYATSAWLVKRHTGNDISTGVTPVVLPNTLGIRITF